MGLGCLIFVQPSEGVKQKSYPQGHDAQMVRQGEGHRAHFHDRAHESRTKKRQAGRAGAGCKGEKTIGMSVIYFTM